MDTEFEKQSKNQDQENAWMQLTETEEEDLQDRWEKLADEVPLTPEEKKEELDFDKLAGLSTGEYLEFWKRLNPFFTTHITRQGVRDHGEMTYHTAGMLQFHEGLTNILENGKVLKTPAEVRWGLEGEITEDSVQKALDRTLFNEETDLDVDEMRQKGRSNEEILDSLVRKLPMNKSAAMADPWADAAAVHCGHLTVPDDMYGAENGNEMFFVFPTDVIASQCRFGGALYQGGKDGLIMADTGVSRKYNDMFVWPQEKNITIDAGLTFLPKSAQVNAETGSLYETEIVELNNEQVRVPKLDEDQIKSFATWIRGLGDEYGDIESLRKMGEAAGVSETLLDAVLEKLYDFKDMVKSWQTGAKSDLQLQVSYGGQLSQMSLEERQEFVIRNVLKSRPEAWVKAENAVTAEEYWERYFAKYPERRPAHVIYYDGDPTEAVLMTLRDAGVIEEQPRPLGISVDDEWQRVTGPGDTHERDGVWLGFEQNLVRNAAQDEDIQRPHREFNELARKIIAEHYGL